MVDLLLETGSEVYVQSSTKKQIISFPDANQKDNQEPGSKEIDSPAF